MILSKTSKFLSAAPSDRRPAPPSATATARTTSEGDGGLADAIEARWKRHDWLNNWRYPGIYDYYHFHSTSHEVLGVARGHMELRLCGEGGPEVTLSAGDALVQSAGVSHIFLGGSDDVLVVGGYPEGRDWDLLRDKHISESGRREAIKLIMSLPIPDRDPVTGEAMREWREAPSSIEWGAPREELDPV